jgi:hypothetical protein
VAQQRLICTDIRCLNKLRLMARCAGQARVFSIKGKPRRFLMIIPGLVEPCDAERTAMVFFMTLHTLMTGQLRMVPLVGGDSRFEFLMTVQAFAVGYRLADRMAAGTIGHALQLRMSCRKFSGGDLAKHRHGHRQAQECNACKNFAHSQNTHRYPNAIATPTCTKRMTNMMMLNGT